MSGFKSAEEIEMKKFPMFAVAFLMMILIITQPAPLTFAQTTDAQAGHKDPPRGVEGVWEGTLDVGAAKLRLVLKVSKEKDGGLAATLDSLDQNALDLPVSSISIEGDALRFE